LRHSRIPVRERKTQDKRERRKSPTPTFHNNQCILLVASPSGTANLYVDWTKLAVEALREKYSLLLLPFTVRWQTWRNSGARTVNTAKHTNKHDPFVSVRFMKLKDKERTERTLSLEANNTITRGSPPVTEIACPSSKKCLTNPTENGDLRHFS
jgi:hypothetical protein